MTNLELFMALGDICPENLSGAEALQAGPWPRVNRKTPVKRAVLIAAVIALASELVGCAVAYARIRMNLVRHNIPAAQPGGETADTAPNVLTDCYPQTLPEGYLLGDGSPGTYTIRHICYYNAQGQAIYFTLSTTQEPDLVLAPPCEKTSLKVSGWDAQLHTSAKGSQMLEWHNTDDGYYACLYTMDMAVDLKMVAQSVDYGEPLPLSFLCKKGQLWDVWYPQQIPEGYQCTDVGPAGNGEQQLQYSNGVDTIRYVVSLREDLSDISPSEGAVWQDTSVAGDPARLLITGSGQHLLFWKNEAEGFYAMLESTDEGVDLTQMAENVAPGEPLEVSANNLGPDYSIALEQQPSAYVGWEPVYPQMVPEGYVIRFVSEPVYGEQHIDYENAAGDSLSYILYFRLGQWGRQFDGMGQPEQVDINGKIGYRIGNNLIWTDEARGFGFCLHSSGEVDLAAIAKSVGPGPELTPTDADKTEKALEQLGDYQITALPKGMVEDGLTGRPLENDGDWYSYVRRWYFDRKTNQAIYFEYESYVADDTPPEEIARMFIGQGNNRMITVNGCVGAALQDEARASVVWVKGDEAKGTLFKLSSNDFPVDALLKMAESVQKQE